MTAPPAGSGPRPADRQPALAGARAILPLALGILPFGLVYGVAVAESSVADWARGPASA